MLVRTEILALRGTLVSRVTRDLREFREIPELTVQREIQEVRAIQEFKVARATLVLLGHKVTQALRAIPARLQTFLRFSTLTLSPTQALPPHSPREMFSGIGMTIALHSRLSIPMSRSRLGRSSGSACTTTPARSLPMAPWFHSLAHKAIDRLFSLQTPRRNFSVMPSGS